MRSSSNEITTNQIIAERATTNVEWRCPTRIVDQFVNVQSAIPGRFNDSGCGKTGHALDRLDALDLGGHVSEERERVVGE
jgi:hypothetical protein